MMRQNYGRENNDRLLFLMLLRHHSTLNGEIGDEDRERVLRMRYCRMVRMSEFRLLIKHFSNQLICYNYNNESTQICGVTIRPKASKYANKHELKFHYVIVFIDSVLFGFFIVFLALI